MLFPAKVRTALVGIVVAGGAAVTAALGPAGPAVGQSSPPTVGQSSAPIQVQMQVNPPATLVAKGAGADISVSASCSGVGSGSVFAVLSERVGSVIAIGSGQATIDCTGTTQTIDVIVAPEPNLAGLPQPTVGVEFKKGTGILTAGIDACVDDIFPCSSQSVEQTIEIGK
jgi:hypothetical protein